MNFIGYVVSPGGTIRKVKVVKSEHNGHRMMATLDDGSMLAMRDVFASRNFAIGYGDRLVADRLEAVKREMNAIEDFARNLQEKPL